MPALSSSQTEILKSLIGAAPDSAIRSLDMALSGERSGTPMGAVRDLVSGEAAERQARRLAFAPMLPLCVSHPGDDGRESFPYFTLAGLWTAMAREAPTHLREVMVLAAGWREGESDPTLLDSFCIEAAEMLREGKAPDFEARLETAMPGGVAKLIGHLQMAPHARRALRRLPEWLGRMTSENAATARLAFKDAAAIAPDAGSRFFEILSAHLSEPWLILRLISAVMDRPTDRFAASSEIARFGERLLSEIDRLIDAVRFDPRGGREAGDKAGVALERATQAITEFEQSLDLNRDGPWGQRIGRQKRELAQAAEQIMRKVEDAVFTALPQQTIRLTGRLTRQAPKLNADPDPKAIETAMAYLAFLDHTRVAANYAGFGASRAKVVDQVGERLDQHVEDLVERLHARETDDEARVRAYLDIAAQVMVVIKDGDAGAIVRRRAAAA